MELAAKSESRKGWQVFNAAIFTINAPANISYVISSFKKNLVKKA